MAQRLARQDWRSGGFRFKSHPRLTFQSWSSYQLNQLRSKAASDSTLKQSTTCGVLNCTFFYGFIPSCISLSLSLSLSLSHASTIICQSFKSHSWVTPSFLFSPFTIILQTFSAYLFWATQHNVLNSSVVKRVLQTWQHLFIAKSAPIFTASCFSSKSIVTNIYFRIYNIFNTFPILSRSKKKLQI